MCTFLTVSNDVTYYLLRLKVEFTALRDIVNIYIHVYSLCKLVRRF